MTTPDDARKLAAIVDCTPITKGDKYIAEALRDLASQVESLQADAERYRWLRDNSAEQWEHPICVEQFKGGWRMRYVGPLTGKSLDKKIDEARKQS